MLLAATFDLLEHIIPQSLRVTQLAPTHLFLIIYSTLLRTNQQCSFDIPKAALCIFLVQCCTCGIGGIVVSMLACVRLSVVLLFKGTRSLTKATELLHGYFSDFRLTVPGQLLY
eukprot:GHUV01027622.1.p1 GENE.GHUV01027622.1~~GHUV01027622.1.p1  ORF type:complete len:114 (-),score=20.53 GHUV01027622.1:221-562(-)